MIGESIQNYKIIAHLGEGGMGTVYKASDSVLSRDVALKMLHAPLLKQPHFLERFKKEARLLAQLLHPNIAVIYNFIEQNSNHFMVMEYVDGKNLESVIKQKGVISCQAVVAIFLQALEGLHHAHKKGIYHRDIKPSNLILTPDGTVKLMDFGIAIMAGEQRLTQVNRVVGTVEFMAPELIQGKEPSVTSDIYATGVTMYELLTGKLPFEGNTDYNLMQDIMKKKPVSLEKLNASVPKSLANIVMKALEKKPESRYATAKEFHQALWSAFPETRELDLSTIFSSASMQPTQFIQLSTKPRKELEATRLASRKTDTENNILSGVKRLRSYLIWENKTKPLLVAGFSLLLLCIVGLSFHLKKKPVVPQPPALSNTHNQKRDSVEKKITNENNPIEQMNVLPVVSMPAVDTTVIKEEGERHAESVRVKEKQQEQKKKQTAVIPAKKEAASKEMVQKETVVEPVINKEEPKESETTYIPKRIRLANRLPVDLYLTEPLDASTIQEGQVLRFSVSNPVFYDGETIIESGAIANGRIKNKGNKKMSIVLISVRAKNGQHLPFQQAELSGRIEDMLHSRHYSAFIKRGTIINF